MKRFLGKLLLLGMLVIMTLVALCLLMPVLLPLSEDFNSTYLDKNQLIINTESPKIIIIGGSNNFMGIDSGEIEAALCTPVVNASIGAPLGLGRMLDLISPYLQQGDTLLIIPEYEHFVNLWNGIEHAYHVLFDAHQYQLLFSPYYGLPNNFFNFFTNHLNTLVKPPPPPTQGSIYNQYGDSIRHLDLEPVPFRPNKNLGRINSKYLKNFFHFVDDFTKRGVTVMLSYPSYEEQSFHNSAALIAELDARFRAHTNLRVISKPEDFCFPTELFYDSVYHLDRKGRALRTERLIRDLQATAR